MSRKYNVFEVCAGAGGQAIGLEQAGFHHVGAAEIDSDACATLRLNRPHWQVEECDIRELVGRMPNGIDIFAGGVPCPPFSVAGKQLGQDDERDLFPVALRLIEESQPRAVMLENVKGLASARFDDYRNHIVNQLKLMGYEAAGKILKASDFGVPQLRPRFILVALKERYAPLFQWPQPTGVHVTVAEAIGDLMLSNGWTGGDVWLGKAQDIGPTIVGGSKKHGGPDLGPTRARNQWASMGVNGISIGNAPPDREFPEDGNPRLTLKMVARLQAFPDDWAFVGNKTSRYRQIGNAFPPPVAKAVALAIRNALDGVEIREDNLPRGKTLDLFGGLHA